MKIYPKQSIGLSLLAKCLIEKRVQSFLNLDRQYFIKHELEVYDFIKNYYDKYGVLPSIDLACQKTILQPVNETDAFGYYHDEYISRTLYNKLTDNKTGLIPKINNILHSTKDSHKAIEEINNFIKDTENIRKDSDGDLTTVVDLGEKVVNFIQEAKIKEGITGIPSGFESLDREIGGFQKGDLYVIVARPKQGKFQPYSEPILTPTGWKPLGDLVIGDEVFTQDGSITKITDIFEQGIKQTYKIEMIDNGYTYAGKEHLWLVKHRSEDNFKKVKNTGELISYFKKHPKYGRVYIPLCKPIKFKPKKLKLDPYLMGLLLGNGSFRRNSITLIKCVKQDWAEMLKHISIDYSKHKDSETIGFKKDIKNIIEYYGLLNKYSYEKFIPEDYKINSIKNRHAILQGLMDTNGTIYDDGKSVEYSTSSKQLSEDIKFLIQSLGGKVRKIKPKKIPKYFYKGKLKKGRTNYTVRFQLNINPFRLSRKAKMFKIGKISNSSRLIKSIVPYKKEKCRCIKVVHPSNLYITRDFIVTHNSLVMMLMGIAAHNAGYTPLWVSMEMKLLQVGRRLYASKTGINMNYMKSGMIDAFAENKIKEQIEILREKQGMYFIEGQFKKDINDISSSVQGLKPDVLFIDGGYLVKILRTYKSSKWEYITDIAENMKTLAMKAGIPVIVSFQFNREQVKSKTTGWEHIQLADAISQLASVGIGIFDENPNKKDEIIIEPIRYIEIIGGREGETAKFEINWDWKKMNFSERK